MTSIVIFGTGSSGMRALRAATNRSDIDVVGFSDNDGTRHGSEIEGLPIIPPTQLDATACDFIVLASQFANEIRAGLIDIGIDDKRMITASLNDFPGSMAALARRASYSRHLTLDDGRQIEAGDLPRVLILTYETLNQSHGTGVLVQRYFHDFPADRLFSICHQVTGVPWLQQSLTLSAESSVVEATRNVRQSLLQHEFLPDLVYATAFDEIDLDVLSAVLDVLPRGIPVIQHFMDYMPHNAATFERLFVALSDRITQTWALTDGMARDLQERYGFPVQHVTALHQEPPTSFKQTYASPGPHFRSVILGNLWQPWMLPMIDRVWTACMEQRPGLRPIEWFVHPLRAQAILDAGYALGDAVHWKGFVTGHALQAQLADAELAILPFNGDASAKDGYSRFSLPSRLTELCGGGLPIVVIASSDTEPARFIRDRQCALLVSGPDESEIIDQLLRIIDDSALRRRLGSAARAVAETEFSLGPFQERLLGKLIRLTEGYQLPPDWAGLAASGVVPLGGKNPESAPLHQDLPSRVHYACGRNLFAGWLNVDGFDESYPCGEVPDELAKQIFHLDLVGPHPFPDNHFEAGYSEDFIEHIDQDAFTIFLCEVFRTFRQGGVLRLSTPALGPILARHLRGSDWQAGQAFREEAYTRWWHKHYLCEQEIETIAHAVGWREMRLCEYGTSHIEGLARETRPDQAALNLVVELIK